MAEAAAHRFEAYHADALAHYCVACSAVQRLNTEFIECEEVMLTTKNGQYQVTPLWNALKEGLRLVHDLGKALGLNPAIEAQKSIDFEKPTDAEDDDGLADAKKRVVKARVKPSGK